MDDLKGQIAFIAHDNPKAARDVAARIRATGILVASKPIGRKGRVEGTREKSAKGLPYVLAYTIVGERGLQTLVILRVIHTARNWHQQTWPN